MSHNFDTDVNEVAKLLQESEKGWAKQDVKKKSLTEGKLPKKTAKAKTKKVITENKKSPVKKKYITEGSASESDYMEILDASDTEKFMKEFKVDKGDVEKVDGGYQLNKSVAKEIARSVNIWNSGKPLKDYEKQIDSSAKSIASDIIKSVESDLGVKLKGTKISVDINNDSTMIEISYNGDSVGRDFFYYTEDSASESIDDSINSGSLAHLKWVFYNDSPFYDSTFNEMMIETEKRMGQNEMTYQDDGNVMELEREFKTMVQESLNESVELSANDQVLCENLVLKDILSEGVSNRTIEQYIETALWSSTNDDGGNLDDDYGFEDVDKSVINQAKKDLDKFFKQAGDLLDGEDETTVAHDFWLTRNGHGAGFWDGDYEEEKGKALSKLADKFPEINLYVGDDGKIHS